MAGAKLGPNLPDWMVEHANRYLSWALVAGDDAALARLASVLEQVTGHGWSLPLPACAGGG